jgi:hypothetical protein
MDPLPVIDLSSFLTVRLKKHREVDKAMAQHQHRAIREKKPAERGHQQMLEPTATYRLGIL